MSDEEEKIYCDGCERLIEIEKIQDYHGTPLCRTCYNEHFSSVCVVCGNRYDRDWEEDAWGEMCSSCADQHFVCENCGETYHDDDYGDNGYCLDCSRCSSVIHDYHNRPHDLTFYPTRSEELYFGVELETEDYKHREAVADDLFQISDNERLFWLEADCSLSEGFEVISHPCTLNYHQTQFPWEEITKIARGGGGKALSSRRAALHIHFSRTFLDGEQAELKQLRLIYIFEKFRTQLAKIARSSDYLLARSAKAYKVPLWDRAAKEKLHQLTCQYDRYTAVNLCNTTTIEIRIFRSTLNPSVILAYIELVDFLARTARDTETAKLQRLRWKTLVKWMLAAEYPHLHTFLKRLSAEENQENSQRED